MSLELREGVLLAPFTSWRVGGPARCFVEPTDRDEVVAALAWSRHQGLPVLVIGKGSNLLVADAGFDGLVIRLAERFGGCEVQGELVWTQGGCPNSHLVRVAAEHGRGGLEWLSTIPGTVGGAIAMNAGAHGACVAEVLVDCEVLEPDGSLHTLSVAALDLRYRHSGLRQRHALALGARWRTTPQPRAAVLERVAELGRWRRERQPQGQSAGSVFANPAGHAAGALIEQCGLKGLTVGRAQVSPVHANFFMNLGGATAADLLELIATVQARVHAATGCWLIPEVQGVGCQVGGVEIPA